MGVAVSSLYVLSDAPSSSQGRLLILFPCCNMGHILWETVLHKLLHKSFPQAVVLHRLLQCESLLQGVVHPAADCCSTGFPQGRAGPLHPGSSKMRERTVVSTQICTQITHVCRHMHSLNAFPQRNPSIARKLFSAYWFLQPNPPHSAPNPHMLKARSHYYLFSVTDNPQCTMSVTHPTIYHFSLSYPQNHSNNYHLLCSGDFQVFSKDRQITVLKEISEPGSNSFYLLK